MNKLIYDKSLNLEIKKEAKQLALKLLSKFKDDPAKGRGKSLYNQDRDEDFGRIYVCYMEDLDYFEFGIISDTGQELPVFKYDFEFNSLEVIVYLEECPLICWRVKFSKYFSFLKEIDPRIEWI